MSVHDEVLGYAKSKLDEAYKREESIKESASMQIAIFSFLITGIITLEIGLFENRFRFFILSLVFSSIIVLTMLIAILFAILSKWRMHRKCFPKACDVIDQINTTTANEKERDSKEQLIGSYAQVADSVDENNDRRTNRVLVAHILSVISIAEMLVFSFIMFIIVLVQG